MRFKKGEAAESNRKVLDRMWRRNNLSCSLCKPGKRENHGRHGTKTRRDRVDQFFRQIALEIEKL